MRETSVDVLFINLIKGWKHAFAYHIPALSPKLIFLDNKPKVDTLTTTAICKTLPKWLDLNFIPVSEVLSDQLLDCLIKLKVNGLFFMDIPQDDLIVGFT